MPTYSDVYDILQDVVDQPSPTCARLRQYGWLRTPPPSHGGRSDRADRQWVSMADIACTRLYARLLPTLGMAFRPSEHPWPAVVETIHTNPRCRWVFVAPDGAVSAMHGAASIAVMHQITGGTSTSVRVDYS